MLRRSAVYECWSYLCTRSRECSWLCPRARRCRRGDTPDNHPLQCCVHIYTLVVCCRPVSLSSHTHLRVRYTCTCRATTVTSYTISRPSNQGYIVLTNCNTIKNYFVLILSQDKISSVKNFTTWVFSRFGNSDLELTQVSQSFNQFSITVL